MLSILLTTLETKDKTFIEKLYDDHSKQLYGIAYQYLQDAEDCKDCIHDTFEILINSLEKFKNYSDDHKANSLVTITRRIAINKYNKKARRGKRETAIAELEKDDDWELYSADESSEDVVINEELIALISEMIESLDPKYRDILYLKYYINLSSEEISKITGLDVSLINVRIMRAKKILLEKNGDKLNELRTK